MSDMLDVTNQFMRLLVILLPATCHMSSQLAVSCTSLLQTFAFFSIHSSISKGIRNSNSKKLQYNKKTKCNNISQK